VVMGRGLLLVCNVSGQWSWAGGYCWFVMCLVSGHGPGVCGY